MSSLSAVIIALVVIAAAGCAGGGGSATMAPTVDVTGKWAGTFTASAGTMVGGAIGAEGTVEMTLKQTGSQVTGSLVVTGGPWDPSGPFQGMVSGNVLRITQPSSLLGSFTVQGDTMIADVVGGMVDRATLQRQK